MIDVSRLTTRIERLRELANDFSIEGGLGEGGNDLMNPAEAAEYTDAIHAAMYAADRARAALEKAVGRIEGS
jgi:hypothetical protein